MVSLNGVAAASALAGRSAYQQRPASSSHWLVTPVLAAAGAAGAQKKRLPTGDFRLPLGTRTETPPGAAASCCRLVLHPLAAALCCSSLLQSHYISLLLQPLFAAAATVRTAAPEFAVSCATERRLPVCKRGWSSRIMRRDGSGRDVYQLEGK